MNKDLARKEALSRINALIRACSLNPNVKKYFEEGKVYYSYLTAGGFMGSIDTIDYDPRYAAAVADFERRFEGAVVYHAIETGSSLALLYVSGNKSDWTTERLCGHELLAYVHSFDEYGCSEFGFISVDGFMDSGALVRIG